jgi:SAM-dependent methyltransferase
MDREDWNTRYAGSELIWTDEPNRFLVEATTSLEPGLALDLAAGEGRNAVWLAERGWRVDAVDFAVVGLDKGRKLAAGRGVSVNWIEADLLAYAPPAARYALVILFYLQLPWNSMRGVLRRAAQALSPGGSLLLVGHDLTNLERGHGGPKSSEVLYTPDQVAAELPELTITEATRRLRPVETEAGSVNAIDCLVLAIAPGD